MYLLLAMLLVWFSLSYIEDNMCSEKYTRHGNIYHLLYYGHLNKKRLFEVLSRLATAYDLHVTQPAELHKLVRMFKFCRDQVC